MDKDPQNILKFEKSVEILPELDKILEKRIRTAFIFPIDQIEQKFGELWGEFKEDNEELTDKEKEFEKIFLEWRKSVLDIGNLQIRIAKNELRKVYRI